MDGTRIVLVRHGESVAQQRQLIGGHTGCRGLSDRGRRQAARLAERLEASGELADTAVVYTSLMRRAAETAEILAPALGGLVAVPDCAFCEHHPGEGDGLTFAEYDHRYPAPARWDPQLRRDPGGESWDEMAARVARGLDEVVGRNAGRTVVVVCHGGVIVHSMVRWLGLRAGGPAADGAGPAWLDPVNTSLTEWRFGPSPFRRGAVAITLVRFNDHAHVRAEA